MPAQIQKELRNEKAVVRCAEQFGLAGDPTRMKICWLLCNYKELSVGEIADRLGVSASTVSHSLKRLKAHELVETRRAHKNVFYRFADHSFNKLLRKSLSA